MINDLNLYSEIKTEKIKDKIKVIPGRKKQSGSKLFFLLKKAGFMNILLVTMISFISINIINSLVVEFRLLKQKDILLRDYNITKLEHENLNRQIKFYDSEKGIEKIARERLGFIKQDEVPVRYLFSK